MLFILSHQSTHLTYRTWTGTEFVWDVWKDKADKYNLAEILELVGSFSKDLEIGAALHIFRVE